MKNPARILTVLLTPDEYVATAILCANKGNPVHAYKELGPNARKKGLSVYARRGRGRREISLSRANSTGS